MGVEGCILLVCPATLELRVGKTERRCAWRVKIGKLMEARLLGVQLAQVATWFRVKSGKERGRALEYVRIYSRLDLLYSLLAMLMVLASDTATLTMQR